MVVSGGAGVGAHHVARPTLAAHSATVSCEKHVMGAEHLATVNSDLASAKANNNAFIGPCAVA
jgi:hypothetical protein